MKRFLLLAGMLLLGQLAFAQNGSYINVLKIPALENAPTHIYINTKILANDWQAPQLQVTGYLYGNGTNKAMKFTLGWYRYQGNFYWTQFHSDLGYQKPSSVKLGVYNSGGTDYVRIELSNDGGYWANYTISATDRGNFDSYYTGWSYGEGQMPSGTSQTTIVPHQADATVYGNLLVGKTSQTNTNYRIDVVGKVRADEIVVNTTGADFVFEEGYKIRKLEELESFIKANKHLPDIPPAKAMQEKGVGVSELQTKLLQKIEELTLYVIELKKEINELKNKK